MGLSITKIDERVRIQMWRNTTGKPIYMNAARDEAVFDLNDDAAFLLVGPDGSLPMEDAKKFGLLGDGEEYDETSVQVAMREKADLEMEANNLRAMIESGHTRLGPNVDNTGPELDLDRAEELGIMVPEAARPMLATDAKAEEAKVENEDEDNKANARAAANESGEKAASSSDTRNKAVSGPERNK